MIFLNPCTRRHWEKQESKKKSEEIYAVTPYYTSSRFLSHPKFDQFQILFIIMLETTMTKSWIISFVVASSRQITLFVQKTDNESEKVLQIVIWQEKMYEVEGD